MSTLRPLPFRATFVLATGALLATIPATARAQTAAPSGQVAPQPTVAQPATNPPPASSGGLGPAAPGLKGLSLWGILPWGGLGFGARFMVPVGIPSLLANAGTSLRDNWDVELGADLLHWSYDYGYAGGGFDYNWTEVVPVVGLMWNIWFNQNFALYPKAELGYALGWFSGWNDGYGNAQPTYGGLFLAGDAGALYKLDNGLTLRAEAGSDGLKLGVGWLF